MNTAVVKVRALVSKNKAIAAALTSFAGVELGALVTWIQSGTFDATETRTAVGGLILALGTYAVTWFTSSGDAIVELPQADKSDPGQVVDQV